MRSLIITACIASSTAVYASEEPEIEVRIKDALLANDLWKQLYQNQTGRAPANNQNLVDVEFVGNAAALPAEFSLPSSGAPKILQQSVLLNCSDLSQSATFSVDKTTTRSTTINWSRSVKLGASVKLSGKVPGLGDLEGSSSAETTDTIGGAATSTETLHWRLDQPTIMSSKTLQVAQFVVEEVEVDDLPLELNILYSGAYEMVVGTPTYQVRNIKRNKCLDVKNETGPSVITWNCHGGLNQQWVVQSTTRDKKKLVSRKPAGKCLDVKRASERDGTDLIVWPCHNKSNQEFDFDVGTPGAITAFSDKCLSAGINKVETKSCDRGGDRRVWKFEPVTNQKKVRLPIEGIFPAAEQRTVTINATVDVAAGINGTVRWGQTQAVTDAYCANQVYNEEQDPDLPLARGETAVRSQKVAPQITPN